MNTNQLQSEYKRRLTLIEKEINDILPKKISSSWILTHGGIDLEHLSPELATSFTQPARQLLSRGGKRWRPMLLLLSAELASSDTKIDNALALTPLVELPHNGSLIVDDIEDHSDFRRGEAAVHILYGEDASINAGNLIYFLPTSLIENSPLPLEMQAKLFHIYCKCMRRLHLGQGMDIDWHNHPDHIPTQEAYETMCRLKTGALSRMAAEIGHIVGEGDPEKGGQLGDIAEKIGLAFQILDDITNLKTGNPGKKRGDDIVERKRSLPVILFTAKNDPTPLIAYMKEAHDHGIEAANLAVESAIALIQKSGAIEEAQAYAESLINSSITALNECFPPSDSLELLTWMLRGF